MSYRNKKLKIIMIIISSNLIFSPYLKKLKRTGLFVNIYKHKSNEIELCIHQTGHKYFFIQSNKNKISFMTASDAFQLTFHHSNMH